MLVGKICGEIQLSLLIMCKTHHGWLLQILIQPDTQVRRLEERLYLLLNLSLLMIVFHTANYLILIALGECRAGTTKISYGRRIAGRLDRVLCNVGWLDLLHESYYESLSQSTSDHSPILLQLLCMSKPAPRPFKFFNYQLKCAGFKEVLSYAWSLNFNGLPMYKIVMKLKYLKYHLRN